MTKMKSLSFYAIPKALLAIGLLISVQMPTVSSIQSAQRTRGRQMKEMKEEPATATSTTQLPPPIPTPAKPIKLSSGLYARELKNGPRLYESYAALTYDYMLPPKSNSTSMVFDYECSNSEYTRDKFACPVFFYLHKIRDELRSAMDLTNLRHPETTSNRAFDIPSCDQLTKHFHSTTITAAKLDEYQELLRSCVDNLIVRNPLVTKFGAGADRQLKINNFGLMIHGFVEQFFQMLPGERRLDKAILVNNLLASNALGFTHFLQEGRMWEQIVTDCKLSNIPSQLVGPEELKVSLLKLQHLVKQNNLDFAIPLTNGGLSEYYKAPLTDCVMTKDTFHVRILVPLKDKTADWKMYSLTSIPFVYNDGEDGTQLICGVKEDDDSLYAFDASSNRSMPLNTASKSGTRGSVSNRCDVNSDLLCYTGRNGQSSYRKARKSCASVTLPYASVSESSSGKLQKNNKENRNNTRVTGSVKDDTTNTEIVSKYCDLHCESIEEFETPILLKVAPDRFYLAGKVSDVVVVQCPGKMEVVNPPAEGAMEIVLPCQCQILLKQQRFVSQEPCSKQSNRDFTMTVVKPIHLAKVTVVEQELPPEGTEFQFDSGEGSDYVQGPARV